MAAVPDLLGTRIVYRSGDPTKRSDLSLVRLDEARGAIVLSDDERPDVAVVQTVLAICAELGDLHSLPVVVEVAEPTTAERLVRACGPTVHPIVTEVGDREDRGVRAPTARSQPGVHGAHRLPGMRPPRRRSGLSWWDAASTRSSATSPMRVRWAWFTPTVGSSSTRRGTRSSPAAIASSSSPRTSTTLVVQSEASRVPGAAPGSGRSSCRPSGSRSTSSSWVGTDLGPDLLRGWATDTAASSTVDVAFDPGLIDAEDVAVPDLGVDVRRAPIRELSTLSLERPPTTIVVLGYTSVGTDEADTRTLLDVMELRRRCSDRSARARVWSSRCSAPSTSTSPCSPALTTS